MNLQEQKAVILSCSSNSAVPGLTERDLFDLLWRYSGGGLVAEMLRVRSFMLAEDESS